MSSLNLACFLGFPLLAKSLPFSDVLISMLRESLFVLSNMDACSELFKIDILINNE